MFKAYGKYKKVRNAAWQTLIDNEVAALPVDVVKIVNDNCITLLKNSDAKELREGESGVSIYDGSEWFIVYDDTLPLERKRFTVAHELGHIFLGHPLIAGFHRRANATTLPPTEKEANSFAIRLLSPACILWGLALHSSADIAAACELPDDMAKERAARMTELYKRGKFLTSPLEKRVFEQFKEYIEQNKKPPK
ncbi:MAG: ImmA/IrrE family metallo-endopeptidase [Defluviitaleaceae bacterium]|nr:ImmA/IrrE family metallo-endopeptidase [Defluviitaleaceae bacterium]